MSLGYAEKLSFIEDVGNVGMAEHFDTANDLQEKVERLASLIHKSKHLVVFTGAGISTSCGIPDFRGPKGIWTLQREGKPLPKASLPFHRAMPSVTHMALVELERAGILHYLISQNVDGLHLKSGIPRNKLSELHGNSFMETCPSCGTEYLRDFEVETIGLKETSRCCSDVKCGTKLRDTVLDWEDALPSKEMIPAEKHCKMADLVLCLGTSLQITPACNLPLKCLRGGGKIVIVNLQKTPKDSKACLVIHGYVDKVISGVMNILKMRIPPFIMIDFVHVIVTQSISEDTKHIDWTLRVANVSGLKFPLSFVKSVEVSRPDDEMWEPMIIDTPPFVLKRRTAVSEAFQMFLKLNLVDGCGCVSCQIAVPFGLKVSDHDFDHKREAILTNLRFNALHVGCCGQTAIVQRKPSFPLQSETSTYALLTNIKYYDMKPKLLGESFRVCSISGKRSNNRKRKSFL